MLRSAVETLPNGKPSRPAYDSLIRLGHKGDLRKISKRSRLRRLPLDARNVASGVEFLDGLAYVKRAFEWEKTVLREVMDQCKAAGHPGSLGHGCKRCVACQRLRGYAERAYADDIAYWYRSHGQKRRRSPKP